MFEQQARERIAFLPTPFHRLKNLGPNIGLDNLWIKRDDLTGLSAGGNKTRKLEFVVGSALREYADTLVTVGAVQSNHCRQTAAVSAMKGLRCVLLLRGQEPESETGNLLMSRLFGAETKFYPDDTFDELQERLTSVTETLTELGLRPFPIPAGAAMPEGIIAYAVAMEELKTQATEQGTDIERIVVASGTCGTQAGMILGAKLLDWDVQIIGVSTSIDSETGVARVRKLIDETTEAYPDEIDKFLPKVTVDDQFVGEGYGILSEGAKSAIELFGKTEGILLDPVYTGKAALGLIRMSLAGDIDRDSPTLFWHTGGMPAVFAYAKELQ
ncbi:MAG: D-cysteine desulfhydrase family protein [Candidatus Thorarchaeota archaeon]|nr:MAG: D-cysteine desulfhydrase family protein [Candidatus Thorarchaeota archaeon]